MKNTRKKAVLLQIGTIFFILNFNIVGILNFHNPKTNNFLSKKEVFADDDNDYEGDDDDYKYHEKDGEDKEEEDDDDDDYDQIQNTNVTPIVDNVTKTTNNDLNTNVTQKCELKTEFVYDTVTSASGNVNKVQRKVQKEVCNNVPQEKIIETPVETFTIEEKKSEEIKEEKQELVIKEKIPKGLDENKKSKFEEKLDKILLKFDNEKKLNSLNLIIDYIEKKLDKIDILLKDKGSDYILNSKKLIFLDIKELINNKKIELEKEIFLAIKNKETNKEYKALNGNIYTLIYKNGIVKIKKSDGSFAKNTFESFIQAKDYLDNNNLPLPENYKAKNGKIYTIMYENKKVVILKQDGTYAKNTFTNYEEAKKYLDQNAPKQIIVSTTQIPKKAENTINDIQSSQTNKNPTEVPNNTSTTKTTKIITNNINTTPPPKPSTTIPKKSPTPSITKTTQPLNTNIKTTTKTSTPIKQSTKTPTKKTDTTTKAS